MKYNKNYTALCLIAAVFAVLYFGFVNGRPSIDTPQDKKTIRIGVSVYRWDDTFITGIRTAIEEQAKIYEQDKGIKVVLDIVDAKESQGTQNGQVERFISLGYDVLCINIVDRSAANNIIDKAINAGTPVVFFNREPVEEDMNRWEKLYYIGADAKETALLQGKILVDAYREAPGSLDLNGDGSVSYVLLEGETSHQDSLIRTEWSIRTLKEGGVPIKKITGGIGNWERSQGSALMEQWLFEYPGEIELVIANNDDMALGAIDAMKRMKVTGINVVGIDGTPPGREALKQGELFGTVACDSGPYAKAILDTAFAAGLNQDITSVIVLDKGKYYWSPQKILNKQMLK